MKPLTVGWEGRTDTVRYGSWAMVNARLLPRLQAREGLDVDVYDPVPGVVDADPGYDVWVTHYYPGLEGRDAWPLPPTNSRRWVVWLAWEHGLLPKPWVDAMRAGRVTEVWVPSAHTRRLVLASSDLDPARVVVVPYGVDPDVYHPTAPAWPKESSAFRVLYVGGALWRKGVDLAVEGFVRAFRPGEPVRLVLKLQGKRTFYHDAPPVRVDPLIGYQWQALGRDDYADAEMAGLYTACDVLVAPYRAEGFGLAVLEAMACGLPVVYPAGGPAPEFVPADAGISVPVKGGEPDADAVAMALRWLWRNPGEAQRMGRAGRLGALHYAWVHRAEGVEARLRDVSRRPAAQDAFTPPAEA